MDGPKRKKAWICGMWIVLLVLIQQWPISEVAKQWVIVATSPFLSFGYVFVFLSAISRMHQMELSDMDGVDTTALMSGSNVNDKLKLCHKRSQEQLAGLWASSNYLGMFLGPTIGGVLIDNYGFQAAALCFSGLLCLTFTAGLRELLSLVSSKKYGIIVNKSRHSKNPPIDENEQLCLLQKDSKIWWWTTLCVL